MRKVCCLENVGCAVRTKHKCQVILRCAQRTLQKLLVVILLAVLYPASADEIRPALLDIKEQNTGLFAVTWKVPTRGNRVLAITPQLPESLELLGSPSIQDIPGARIEHATYKNNAASLTGQRIVIEGLSAVQTDVLLLIQLQDGIRLSCGQPHPSTSSRWRHLNLKLQITIGAWVQFIYWKALITCCLYWRCY